MEQQEVMVKINELGQEAQALEQRIGAIDNHIKEMSSVKESLIDLESSSKDKGKKEEKEILSNLGKGIFVKAKVNPEEKVMINVGKDILVKKTGKEAIEIIENQLSALMNGREEIIERIQALQEEMQMLIQEAQGHAQSHKEKCERDDCECEEPCEDCECEKK